MNQPTNVVLITFFLGITMPYAYRLIRLGILHIYVLPRLRMHQRFFKDRGHTARVEDLQHYIEMATNFTKKARGPIALDVLFLLAMGWLLSIALVH